MDNPRTSPDPIATAVVARSPLYRSAPCACTPGPPVILLAAAPPVPAPTSAARGRADKPPRCNGLKRGLLVYLLSCWLVACDVTAAPTPGSSRPPLAPATPVPIRPAVTNPPLVRRPAPPTQQETPLRPTSALLPPDPAASQAYLHAALAYLQQNYARRTSVNWAAWQQQIAQTLPPPRTPGEAYAAIRVALDLLGDPHLQFFPPDDVRALQAQEQVVGLGLLAIYPERVVVTVDAGGVAAQAGVQVGDRIERINDTATLPMSSDAFFTALFAGAQVYLQLARAGTSQAITVVLNHAEYYYPLVGPQGQRLPHAIGYLTLPGLSASEPLFHQYAGLVQQHIRDIDQTPTCGWILDLRGNTGGDMWDMLAAIGPLLGEGVVGAFVYPSGQREVWRYQAGGAWRDGAVWAQVDQPYRVPQSLPPVAILTDAQTASAGEAVVVAFQGRPNTRRFGQPTAGLPTHRDTHTLSDGAWLIITVALDADRTGRIYDGAIAPDQAVPRPVKPRETAHDPVVQAAQTWLQAQATCSRGPTMSPRGR